MSCSYKRVRSLLWREILSCPAEKNGRVPLVYTWEFLLEKNRNFGTILYREFYEFNFLLIFLFVWKANLVF